MTKKEQREVTLKRLRAIKGKNQTDIANRLNELGRIVDQAQVSRWERGEITPTIEAAIDMAKAYEVSIIDLLIALGFELDDVIENGQGGKLGT